MLPQTIRETAYEWHSGGGSPLYQFASTDGQIIDSYLDLIGEISECQITAHWDTYSSPAERATYTKALRELREYVEAL